MHQNSESKFLLASISPYFLTLFARHFRKAHNLYNLQEKRKIESEPGASPLTPACRARWSWSHPSFRRFCLSTIISLVFPCSSLLRGSCRQSKKSQFTLRRKKSKTELDFEDMLCPIASFWQIYWLQQENSYFSSCCIFCCLTYIAIIYQTEVNLAIVQ